jgi:soluble lytic murein transglycosylase-like protein
MAAPRDEDTEARLLPLVLWALGDSMSAPLLQRRSPLDLSLGQLHPVRVATNQAGVEQWRGLVAQYDWPVAEALRVMACESGGNAAAESGYGDGGLMQIRYAAHYDKVASYDALFDPATNIAVAYRIWRDQGWAPWGCSP